MNAVGRNDPCPCGSGLKYKKCCLERTAFPPSAFTADERASALRKLFRFSERPEFEDDHFVAEAAFWADYLDALPDDESPNMLASEESEAAFHEWFALDFDLESGPTPVGLFVEREGSRLTWDG